MSAKTHTPYFAAAVILCSVALAQPPNSPQQTPTGPPSAAPGSSSPSYPGNGPLDGNTGSETTVSDKSFVKQAADRSVTEMELAKLAQEKASSDAVKEFSKRIVDDQTKLSQNLQPVAAKVNVEVPSDLSKSGKKAKDKLAKLSGPEFDRAYTKMMLNNQKEDADSFSQEARLGKIPEVKDFANSALPTVETHRKMAQQLEASTKK
jgi:putative membrane protein